MTFDYQGKVLDNGGIYKTLCQRYNGGADMDVQLTEAIEKISQGEMFIIRHKLRSLFTKPPGIIW